MLRDIPPNYFLFSLIFQIKNLLCFTFSTKISLIGISNFKSHLEGIISPSFPFVWHFENCMNYLDVSKCL